MRTSQRIGLLGIGGVADSQYAWREPESRTIQRIHVHASLILSFDAFRFPQCRSRLQRRPGSPIVLGLAEVPHKRCPRRQRLGKDNATAPLPKLKHKAYHEKRRLRGGCLLPLLSLLRWHRRVKKRTGSSREPIQLWSARTIKRPLPFISPRYDEGSLQHN